MQFGIQNAERMRIDSSGRLLVGTSAARSNFFNSTYSGPFQVEAASSETLGRTSSFVYGDNNTSGPIIAFGKHRGTSVGGNTIVQSDDEVGRIIFQGSDGTHFIQAASINAHCDGTPGTDDMPGRLTFHTTPDGSTSPVERMRIDSSGNVFIAGTSAATAGIALNANGTATLTGRVDAGASALDNAAIVAAGNHATKGVIQAYHYGSGTVFVGGGADGVTKVQIDADGTGSFSGIVRLVAGAYVGTATNTKRLDDSSNGSSSATLFIGNAAIQVSSDVRLKENIEDTNLDALSAIQKIDVKDFTWNDPSDTSFNNRNARGKWTGLIAQELVEILPFIVNAPRKESDGLIDHDSEETWTLDQSQLCPVLIKAMQQQQEIISALEQRLTDAGL